MKPILFIKGDDITNVRLNKFINYFTRNNTPVLFYGWNRQKRKFPTKTSLLEQKYILKGGGIGKKVLLLYYPLWIILLFIKLLINKKKIVQYNIIVINFESALPVFIASKFCSLEYIYEIRDDFALSYNFPSLIKRILLSIDRKIKIKSNFVIHVDENRVKNGERCIIIENSPNDFFKNVERDYSIIKHMFAIIGNMSHVRGLSQIYSFAKENPSISFVVAGKFYDSEFKKKFSGLNNIVFYDFMPQIQLYKLLSQCCGIFSLYDPKLEINRLAASNKLYDAMMLGIPVITNKEVVNSEFVRKNKIGIVINYEYDNSWDILSDKNFINYALEIGLNGRDLFLNKFQFDKLITENLVPMLK